jgi:hypothetical protein
MKTILAIDLGKRRKIAIIAVARHLLMRCWAMLRDNKPWQYKIRTVV